MEKLLGVVLTSVVMLLISVWAARRQAAASAARREATRRGESVTCPVRLRGRPSSYPGYWRAGQLSDDPATFLPRGRWGRPQSLAGAKIRRERDRETRDYLPPTASDHRVLTCVDAGGRTFQLATAPDDVDFVKRIIRRSHDVVAPDSETAPLQWLRNRMPFAIMIMSLLGLVLTAGLAFGIVTATPVQATITENRGGDYLCIVKTIGHSGNVVKGYVPCDGLPGEQVGAYLRGWPRTDTLTDRESEVIWMSFAIALFLLGLFFTANIAYHRRVMLNRSETVRHG